MGRWGCVQRRKDQRARYRAQKLLGLCAFCTRQAVPGHVLCAEHGEQQAEYQRKRRKGAKEDAICNESNSQLGTLGGIAGGILGGAATAGKLFKI